MYYLNHIRASQLFVGDKSGIQCMHIYPVIVQVLMFSATLHSQEVMDCSKKICQNPVLVDLKVSACSAWLA